MFTRSTTSNQRPLPTSCNALIKNVSAPCVTAVLILATLADGLRCPVLSAKLYTATVIGLPAAGAGIVSNSLLNAFLVTVGCSASRIACVTAQPVKFNNNNNVNNSFIRIGIALMVL